ncbi:MAG: saccharopine dehydrogenase NADP-binding domain-containing protein [Candidatus Hermodarchaeota archaeon]|nr:saccharopine dehydrogenase NADP-binding domain-containing protein [Candidatus Hermodarchaeota archaeon]
MARITVLGGCGAVGSVAVRTLTELPDFDEVLIADINTQGAQKLASQLGKECTPIEVDALNSESILEAVKGSDVVLNCVGPFYQFGQPILEAVIKAKINYVDICDDVDPTRALLAMNSVAKKANISACIGMGSSPGVTNLLTRFANEQLLDKIEAIDIYHAHGGEPVEGAAVIAHRIHAMTSPIPMFLEGKPQTVRFFDEAGIALREEVDFNQIGKYLVYPYPHPETITLPDHIKCKRVTNKGTVLPDEYFQFIIKLVQLGVTSEKPIDVKGTPMAPRDFTIAYIIQERERILRKTNFGEQRGCVKTVVSGTKKGKPHQYVFSLSSIGQGMGEGTGIPAALGATLMYRGKIKTKGVLPPEACVDPMDFLGIMQESLKLEEITGKQSPLLIESIDAKGNIKHLSL